MSQTISNTQIESMFKKSLSSKSNSFYFTEQDLVEWTIASIFDPVERQKTADFYSHKKVTAEYTNDGSTIVRTSTIKNPSLQITPLATSSYTDRNTETITTGDWLRAKFELSATFSYGTSGGYYFVDATAHNIRQTFTGDVWYDALPSSRYNLGRSYSSGREQASNLPLNSVEILASPRYQDKFSIWITLNMKLHGYYGGGL